MSWVHNIDAELHAANQSDSNGISNAPPQPINSTAMDDPNTENNEKEKENPIAIFAERVTIAGLEEAYKAEKKSVRIIFRIALIAAFASIIYLANSMYDQYHDTTAIVLKEIDQQPPFPNISICFSPYINESAKIEKINAMVIPARLTYMMKHYNVSFSDMLGYMQTALAFHVKLDDMVKPVAITARMLFSALREQAIKDGQETFDILEYPCSGRITNCSFDGQSIDCCQFVEHIDIWERRCLNLQPDKMKDTNRTEETELHQFTFNAMIDWEFGQEIMTDGFDLFIGKLPGQNQVPITVPSGMDVAIALSQPKKIHQIYDCWPAQDAPNLTYFDYYDQEGINCIYERAIWYMDWAMECKIPAMSYVPLANQSCSFSQWLFVILVYCAEMPKELQEISDTLLFKAIADVLSGRNSNCRPLCTRWVNHVHSASFSLIDYSNGSKIQSQMQNKSWSRIRIVMPDMRYMDHQEMEFKAWYLAMCDIGGMMGVYAGFSAITFVQIIAYGAYVIWWKWKNRHNIGKAVVRLEEPAGPSNSHKKPNGSRIPVSKESQYRKKIQNRNAARRLDLKKKNKAVGKVDNCDTAC